MDEETGKILQRDFEEQKSSDRIRRQERVHLHSICFREWATKEPTDASVKGIHGEPGIADTERYEREDGDEHPATT